MVIKKKIIAFIVILVVLIHFVVYISVSEHRENNQRGECIMIQPSVCVRGSISHRRGTFSSGPVVYRLWFKGKTSNSGEVCEKIRRVTEDQFNRWMY